MWVYVDINTWCVVFHINEHVMCGLSYWWTRACVSFVLALCCNALAFSRNEISKFSKLIFWILLVVYNIKWLIFLLLVKLLVIFLYRSRIKFYGLVNLSLGAQNNMILSSLITIWSVFNMTVTAWISRILKKSPKLQFFHFIFTTGHTCP